MQTIKKIEEFGRVRSNLKGRVGFVATMGYLHEGHLSLVRAAKEKCDHVVVSIYVNPKQFAPNEDFKDYPRDVENDLKMLESEGVDIVFVPSDEEMYPLGFNTCVRVGGLTKMLEGKSRPGFFEGVTTVVSKLLNIVMADIAFFGQKDFQQSVVVRRMAKDLNMKTVIEVCPIIREASGLAISSRNKYLSKEEKEKAGILYSSISDARKRAIEGEKNASELIKFIRERIESVISRDIGKVDYISINKPDNLDESDVVKQGDVISLAVFVGRARLIDNIII